MYTLIKKLICFFVIVILVLIASFLGILVTYGIPLHKFIPASKLTIENLKLDTSSIVLKFDGRFKLTSNDILITDTKTNHTYSFYRLSCYFDNEELLHGNIAPDSIVIDKPVFNMQTDGKSLLISQSSERSNATTKTEIPDGIFPIINMIRNSEKGLPKNLHSLSAVQINEGNIYLKDTSTNTHWDADIEYISIEKLLDDDDLSQGVPLVINAKINIKREKEVVPVTLTASADNDEASIAAKIEDLSQNIFKGYIDEKTLHDFKSKLTLDAEITINSKDEIKKAQVNAKANKVKLTFKEIFKTPLLFNEINALAKYDGEKDDLSVTANINDINDIGITSEASITALNSDPYLKSSTKLDTLSIDHIEQFIPAIRRPQLYTWLVERLNHATISGAVFNLSGPVNTLFENQDTKIESDFDFTGLSVKFLPKAPEAENLNGHFKMRQGDITITSDAGNIAKQKIKDLTVYIGDAVFDGDLILKVTSQAAGDIKELTEIITNIAGASPIAVTGSHNSNVKITIPLLEDIYTKDIFFDINGKAQDVTYTLEADKKYLFKAKSADVSLYKDLLTISGNAAMEGNTFKFKFTDSILDMEKKLKVNASGQFKLDQFIPKPPKEYVVFEDLGALGDVTVSRPNLSTWSIDYNVNLQKPRIVAPLISYIHQPKPVKLKGNLTWQGNLINLNNLSANSTDLTLTGNAVINYKNVSDSKVYIHNLVTDKVNLTNSRYDQGKVELNGKKLYIFKKEEKKNDQKESGKNKSTFKSLDEGIPADLNIKANLQNVDYGKNHLTNLSAIIVRNNKKWQNLYIKTDLAPKTPFELSLSSYSKPPKITARTDDLGAFMKILQNDPSTRKGKVDLEAATPLETSLDLSNLKGTINIKDVSIVNQPILLQILSYFTLQKWLSSESGVPFSNIAIKFSFVKEVLTLEEAKLDGPLISINIFDTKFNLATREIYGRGKAVPLRSIGKVTEYIPLIGNLISETQQAVVAVPFKIRGTMDKPSVSFIF